MPLQTLERSVLSVQFCFCLDSKRLVKSLHVRFRRELSKRDIVMASYVRLPDPKEVEPGKGKIAAFQYL